MKSCFPLEQKKMSRFLLSLLLLLVDDDDGDGDGDDDIQP